jgi:hypothetical protein
MADDFFDNSDRRSGGVRINKAIRVRDISTDAYEPWNWDETEIPSADWDDFAASRRPESNAPPAPTSDERARGVVRTRPRGGRA